MVALPFHRLLSTTDLQTIARDLLGIDIWVYSRDGMPGRLRPGFYVINLDGAKGPGTHWVSFVKMADDDSVLYMDSFGLPPPQDQLDGFLSNDDVCWHNTRQLQHIKSILCGFYCLAFFHYFLATYKQTKRPTDILQGFASLFSDNQKKNETVLKKYLRKVATP